MFMHPELIRAVSTHSRLKAAGATHTYIKRQRHVSTHSRLKAAGSILAGKIILYWLFQHTAA